MDRNNKAVKQLAKDNVALRKESVDRNDVVPVQYRRQGKVALRKESVDRNVLAFCVGFSSGGRSPQGERG